MAVKIKQTDVYESARYPIHQQYPLTNSLSNHFDNGI